MKKAVIFGGSGFVGTHIAKRLLEEDVKVILADILPPRIEHDNIEFIECDVRKPILFSVEGVDRIYNVAAVHVTPGHEDYEYYETNILGAVHITEFCHRHNIPQLVFTSSISVYGPDESEKVETSTLNPISAYGKSKYMAELVHKQWLALNKKNQLAIVRPAVVFGEGEHGNYFRLAKALKQRIFFYPGRKDTKKACIYVKELVRSMDFAFEQIAKNDQQYYLYNGCMNPTPTLENACIAFHESVQLPLPWLLLPTTISKMMTWPFVVLDRLGIKKNGIRPERIDKLVKSTNIVCERLKEDHYSFEWDLQTALKDWNKASAIDGVTKS